MFFYYHVHSKCIRLLQVHVESYLIFASFKVGENLFCYLTKKTTWNQKQKERQKLKSIAITSSHHMVRYTICRRKSKQMHNWHINWTKNGAKSDKKYLNTLDEIILFKENFPKPTLTTGIVLEIELIKAMKCTLVCMNIHKVHVQVISVQSSNTGKKFYFISITVKLGKKKK